MEKTPFWGLPEAQKANWRSQLRAQSSQMPSIPLGPPENNSFCAKHKEVRYVRSLGKKPHFGAFPEAQKGVVIYAICLRKAAHSPNNNANPRGYQKKSLLCRKSAILSIRWKKPHFGAFPEAQKANWRSQLRAQSSQMHSIPLGPSENNSFCAKTQGRRDMCDP